MNMMDLLRAAQGGNGIDNLARQFGLGHDETEQVVARVLPAVSTGFKQRAQSSSGLDGILRQLQGTGYEDVYDNADLLGRDDTRSRGNDILGQIFGSKDVSRSVAQRTEQSTGIGSTVIKAMLPVIVSMVLGGMQRQTSRDSGMGGILGDLLNGSSSRGSSAGGLDDLLGQVLGQQQSQPSRRGGGGLGGILGGLFGGGRQSPPQRQPAPRRGGLRDMFGGGRRRQVPPQEIHPQAGGTSGGFGDLLGGILGTSPKQRRGTGDKNLDSVIGMFDSDGDGSVDTDVLRQLARGT